MYCHRAAHPTNRGGFAITLIVAGIISLAQHNEQQEKKAEQYRPRACSQCGKSGVWRHGHYQRKSDRQSSSARSLNPIPIPRFYCPQCHVTLSVLPECIPPRRHYLWEVQQAVLILYLQGISIREQSSPARSTIRRWCQRLSSQFKNHFSALCSLLPDMGRFTEYILFWSRLLECITLSYAMFILNANGVIIP